MVNDPLAGAKAKIARAQEHADLLNAELNAFMNGDASTDSRGIIYEDHLDKGECHFRWYGSGVTPVRWSVVLGEFFYDLRSALDHIAHVLSGGTRFSEFPVFHDEDTFKRKARLEGMSAEARAAVETLQPFREWPEHPKQTTLWRIHDLCNIDKHNLLHLTDIWLANFSADWSVPFVETRYIAGRQPLKHNTPLASYSWDPALMRQLGDQQVHMQFRASFDVALTDFEGVTPDGEPTRGIAVQDAMRVPLEHMKTQIVPTFERLV